MPGPLLVLADSDVSWAIRRTGPRWHLHQIVDPEGVADIVLEWADSR